MFFINCCSEKCACATDVLFFWVDLLMQVPDLGVKNNPILTISDSLITSKMLNKLTSGL